MKLNREILSRAQSKIKKDKEMTQDCKIDCKHDILQLVKRRSTLPLPRDLHQRLHKAKPFNYFLKCQLVLIISIRINKSVLYYSHKKEQKIREHK